MFASSGASSSYLASITHAAPSRLTWTSLMVGYSTMSISKCLSIAVRIACASAAPLLALLAARSEEHTSELQSRSDIVCRLLLEKKKLDRRSCQDAMIETSK